MSASTTRYADLPRTDKVRVPPRFMLHGLRPLARFTVRRRFGVRVHGLEHVPNSGPVIFAANHVSVMDGPLLAMFAPRPVHALTKNEMFRGGTGLFLRWSGQIPLDRFHPDPNAAKMCLRVLQDDRAIGIFPEGRRGGGDLKRFHRGAAYFGLVTGAPVVPVVFLGSREPGGHTNSLPARGGVVDIVFGPPHVFAPTDWPRTKEQVGHASLLLREHMQFHLERALSTTGRTLPGPLPAAEVESDPATGVSDQGAP